MCFDAFKDEGILVIPSVADPPPKLGGKEIQSEDYQSRAFSLLSIASLSGCCQVKFSPCHKTFTMLSGALSDHVSDRVIHPSSTFC